MRPRPDQNIGRFGPAVPGRCPWRSIFRVVPIEYGLRPVRVLHARPANATDHSEKSEGKETEFQHRFYGYSKKHAPCPPLSAASILFANFFTSQGPVVIGFLPLLSPSALHWTTKCHAIFLRDNSER